MWLSAIVVMASDLVVAPSGALCGLAKRGHKGEGGKTMSKEGSWRGEERGFRFFVVVGRRHGGLCGRLIVDRDWARTHREGRENIPRER